MCKTYGKPASKLLKWCAGISTEAVHKYHTYVAAMENHQLISNLSKIHSHSCPHPKSLISSLFEQLLYPESTAPIITKTNLRKV